MSVVFSLVVLKTWKLATSVYTQNANLFTNSAQMEMFESSISTFSLGENTWNVWL